MSELKQFWESDPVCNIRPLLWHDAVFLLFAFFLFNDFDHWTYVREPHPLSEGKHRTFLCPIGQFCAINRNCNSQRPTQLVDREHSNHNTWLSNTTKSSSNMPEWAQKWTHISPAPPPILAIGGEQTAFRLAWIIQTTLSEYQALSEVVLNTYPILLCFPQPWEVWYLHIYSNLLPPALKAAYMYLKSHSNHYPYP